MRFIDPRIDFAFKKIFGSESAKEVLVSFLESLLGLEGERCIAELTILDPFLAPKIRELKYSILDVKCRDRRGVTYIVEMQVQKVAAFLKRIQYNAAKAYAHQIERGEDYPKLNQVITITITDFVLFSGFAHCVSRHESRETLTGHSYLQDILHFFVELPKFTKPLEALDDILDRWIYFIKYAGSLQDVPEKLNAAPFRHAFEMARVANMTAEELEMYDKAGIAIADAQGAVELARAEALREGAHIGEQKGRQDGIKIGEQKGEKKGKADFLCRLLQQRFGDLPVWASQKIAAADLAGLEGWSLRILDAPTLESALMDPP
ncbi:MAG: Rpn family recombination-promoting nuclease/putative transposase [Magnetococcales bacterium]|nr:Rpn family recombination-promoting nuclease/putative transposase [Magnetococcales bacterium]MBF0114591.1 Rpn family recombination-promoting nuclease/putative transposase [Magnetococcales bacterium]